MRRLTRTVLAMIAILSIYSPSIAIGAPTLSELCAGGQVSPAIGVGSVHLGDSLVDTVKRLGSLRRAWVNQAPDAGQSDSGWRPEPRPVPGTTGRERVLLVAGAGSYSVDLMATDGLLDSISISHLSGCSESHGITLDTPGRAIVNAYGQPDAMRRSVNALNLVYNSLGLEFGLKPSSESLGPVFSMMVFHPGQFCRIAGKATCAKYTPPLT